MNLAVWIVSGVLAALYLMAGFTKLVKTKQDLVSEPRMSWAGDFTEGQVKGIGAVEVAGAIGLVLPWLTGIAPILTPIAAIGLALVQVGAAITHIRRGEGATVPVNLVLCALAVFVAVVRFGQL
ncbi:DoxX family protein [Lentzea sp. BCCO 10_0061]|uniref:DoxX family protein n=1 Tax=Lentzea sokolovensis TaxID=3095429 RepID=A0ABU4VBR0_9PSEU|nr:DoxX family protein [Lentzea sp. BCCO 10_0061]MDX8148624.1 DoxX family protein [Lentzea sp. BCCO 10_0061]